MKKIDIKEIEPQIADLNRSEELIFWIGFVRDYNKLVSEKKIVGDVETYSEVVAKLVLILEKTLNLNVADSIKIESDGKIILQNRKESIRDFLYKNSVMMITPKMIEEASPEELDLIKKRCDYELSGNDNYSEITELLAIKDLCGNFWGVGKWVDFLIWRYHLK